MIDFKLRYDQTKYLSFLKSHLLPEDFADSKEKVSTSFQSQYIQNIVKLGEVPSLDLCIYEVEHLSENDPRISLSRETFRLMAQYGKKRALVFLFSKKSDNFRLSLVTIDIKWNEGKKAQKEYSNPRRYSFFLGPEAKTHTPEEYLVELGRIKDFEDLKRRFSIEVVNKEFYTQIAILFTRLAGGKREMGRKTIDAGSGDLKLPSSNEDTLRKEFTVRLIGRLVFCWFLKKKKSDKGLSLLAEELLSVKAVEQNKGYYHSILEPLFFEVLNTPVESRDKKFKSIPWNQTPFLNGGLFNPHINDFYEPGALKISKHINTLKIPDDCFNELFKIFETYNFTIDENTSVDVELSIEPEMLGRIFENLLAEINPETGETARKATGSYYTPRPIVDYMVDESLKQYLTANTNLPEEKISKLLTYDDLDMGLEQKEKEAIINALDTIKSIDPACGSGAFPMGILHKMLLILQKVDPDSQNWFDKKLVSIVDSTLRKDLKSKLKADNFNYIHKLGIIRDAIYGVDIQPIAVEISKLRFFLSLIVDEKVNDTKENRGIEPLPNLEFKFVCANSLVGLPKVATKIKKEITDKQQTMFEATTDIDLLKNLRNEYLRSFGDEKKVIEKKFQEVQSRMFRHSLDWGGQDSQTLKLAQWNPFSEEPCSWFDPDWMFGVKDGFNIVIANPPYVNIANLSKESRDTYKNLYFVTKNKVDLYAYFIEKGLNLFKKNAILTYIIPQTWKATTSFSKLRELIFKNHTLLQIVDLDFGIFEAIVKPVVIFIVNKLGSNYQILVKNDNFEIINRVGIQEIINGKEFEFDSLSPVRHKVIFKKMEQDSTPLSNIIQFSRGIKTSNDGKFVTSDKEKINNEYRKVYRGKNIKAYSINWGGEYVWYRPDLMREKAGCLPHSTSFFEVPEKIVTQRVNSSMQLLVAYDNKKRYFMDTVNVSNYETWNKNVPLKYICGILNSNLINFYYCSKYRMPTIGGYELHSIPIKLASSKIRYELVTLVNKIIEELQESEFNKDERKKHKVEDYRIQIDKIVYELYGLTKEEIAIVEKF